MQRLLSDNGSEFANATLKTTCAILATKKVFISPLHPQSNGQVERLMQTIKKLVTSQVTLYPLAWDVYLPRVQYIYNTSLHKTTSETPYFLWFARIPPSFQHLTDNLLQPDVAVPLSVQQYKEQLIHHLVSTSSEVAAYLVKHNNEQPPPALQHTFETGDLVWLEDKSQTSKAHSRKLANIWTGPFMILEVLPNRNVRLLRPTPVSPRQEIKVSFDRLRRYLVPIFQPWMHGQTKFKFPLFIRAKRIRNGKAMYQIQWLSHDETPDSWEPAEKLPLQLLYNYEQLLQNKSLRLPDSSLIDPLLQAD
jgi:hypothetical protein